MGGIEEFLKKIEGQGLLRVLRPACWRRDGKICINHKVYIDFSSNDYLGLSGHPKLIEAGKAAIEKFGTSSSASRLLSGDSLLFHQLEQAVAGFKGKQSALVFNSGYQANVGIISSLYTKKDAIFSDRLNHASIIDGIVLSGARFFRFQHNDTGHLESLLKKERARFNRALIISESVFSMDGDKAPLKELVELKEKYDCQIFIDEAHAGGIFGKTGSGLIEEFGLEKKIDLIMGTFGKAMGGFGAYLAASEKIKQFLINSCRAFIYSTALPPAVVAVNLAVIDLIKEEPQRRNELLSVAQYLRNGLKSKGFEIKGESQIIPIIIKDNFKTKEFAQKLQEKGWWALAIRPPTVPRGQARIRISLTFSHKREMLDKFISDIQDVRI